MPHYTTLPADMQTEIEKVTGANYSIDVILDPGGDAIPLSGKYGVDKLSSISKIRDLNIEYSGRPTTSETELILNDPDNYLNPNNSCSPFYNVCTNIAEKYKNGDMSIRVINKDGLDFSQTKKLYISDGINTEEFYPLSVVQPGTIYDSVSDTCDITVYDPGACSIVTYEAEDATIDGSSVIQTAWSGYSGTGYVNLNNAIGSYVQFSVNVPAARDYIVKLRYANGTTDSRAMSIDVNSVNIIASQNFNTTGAWEIWETQSFTFSLTSGANTIKFTSLTAAGGPNIDKLDICQGGDATVFPAGISLDPSTYTIGVNTYLTITPTITPNDTTNKLVTWDSSDDAVATVTDLGVVTGVAAGTATITATASDGVLTDTSVITVSTGTISVTGISISPSTVNMTERWREKISATISPSSATTQTIDWTSSDEDIALVDSVGVVTGVSAGVATITAETTDGSFTDTTSVTVASADIELESISVTPTSDTIYVGTTTSLSVAKTPSNATNIDYVWTSSDESVAIVSSTGVVTGISPGTATITYTAKSSNNKYYEIILSTALSRSYGTDAYIYTPPNAGREVLVRFRLSGCSNYIIILRARLLRDPEATAGKATLVLVDLKKGLLDRTLIGADSGDDNLKRIDVSGDLSDSIVWSDGSAGTLDRSKIVIGDNCKLTQWMASFLTATTFTLSCSDNIVGTTGSAELVTEATLVSGQYPFYFNNCHWIYVSDGFAYVAAGYANLSGVTIIDVTSPDNPLFVTRIRGDNPDNHIKDAYRICVKNNYLYVVSAIDRALTIFDISNPASPQYMGHLFGMGASGVEVYASIDVAGDYAYITSYTNNALYVVNVANPSYPYLAGSLTGAGSPNYMNGPVELKVFGNYVYVVTETERSLTIVDVSIPESPSVAGVLLAASLPSPLYWLSPRALDINDDATYAYIGSLAPFNIVVIDISDPTSPSYVSVLLDAGPPYLDGIRQIKYRDNRLYVASQNDSAIEVVDVSDPTTPVHADYISGAGAPNFLSGAYRLFLYGDHAYVLSFTDESLSIIRISTSDTNIIGSENIRIPMDAWGGVPASGDTVTFSTAINFDSINVVSAIRTVYETYAEVDSSQIDRSSYFGDKNIGTLYEDVAASETNLKIAISVPQLIKTGETLIITEGETTEEVSVASGNDTNSKYPPYIEITSSALSNAYTSAATVVWKERTEYDSDFTFDLEYHYCDIMGYNISLSLDRSMSILQAIEEICKHADAFTYQDNWGTEKIFIFRPHYFASAIPALSDTTNLSKPNPTIGSLDPVNRINLEWGYDFKESTPVYSLTYPPVNDFNISADRHGFEIAKTIRVPGVQSEAYAQSLAQHKYYIYQNGIKLYRINTTHQGIVIATGDRFGISNTNPEIGTEIEIYGISGIQILGDEIMFEFFAYDASLFNDFFMINDSELGSNKLIW